MIAAMVAPMGWLWFLPWDCYGCCHGIAMVAAMVVAMVGTIGLLWLLPWDCFLILAISKRSLERAIRALEIEFPRSPPLDNIKYILTRG